MAVGGEDVNTNYLRLENESTRRIYKIWPFGRLHTARLS